MTDHSYDETGDFTRGLDIRREVLGPAHVERSLARGAEDPFLGTMQQIATEFAWGKVWARPGLPRKTRSFLSMAFLIAGGKHEELKIHVRGALNNGASREEITEVLVQAAVYCGFPAALEGFRLAKEVLDEAKAGD